jgi:hypothetical protein
VAAGGYAQKALASVTIAATASAFVFDAADLVWTASGAAFFSYLANEVQMSEAQKRTALTNPDVARVISYVDHTGETAINNVMRGLS